MNGLVLSYYYLHLPFTFDEGMFSCDEAYFIYLCQLYYDTKSVQLISLIIYYLCIPVNSFEMFFIICSIYDHVVNS